MIRNVKHHLSRNENLLKHGFLILIAGVIAGFFNYLFQIFMGRQLGPENYSVLGALLAITNIVAFGFGPLQTAFSKHISRFNANKEYGKIKSLLLKSSFGLFLLGLLILIILIVYSEIISGFLNIEENNFMILIGIITLLSLFTPLIAGNLNGLQKFSWLATLNISNAGMKLILGLILVSFGLSITGALLGIGFAYIFMILLTIIPLFFLFGYKRDRINHLDIMKYSLISFISLLPLTLMINFDVILVKHFFDAASAGFYVAASNIGKIIWFVSGPMVMVMFPKVAKLKEEKKDTSSLLRNTLFYVSVISLFGVLAYFLVPTFISNLFYGKEYKIAGLIPYFGIAIGFFTLSNLLVMYNLAINRTKLLAIMPLAAFLIEIVAIFLFHELLLDVVKIIAGVSLILFFSLLLYTVKELGVKKFDFVVEEND